MLGVIALEYSLFASVAALLAVVAFLATIVPATRAARLDPMVLRR
jgi:ABC-type lipoprotein release transport system permease subunit